MVEGGITINGQHYDSPKAMPPDVRRTYEEAMKVMGSSLASGGSDTTEVFHGSSGFGVKTNVVVRKKVTVNNRTYGSVDEMPPDVRKLVEGALPAPGVHVWLEVGRHRIGTAPDSGGPAPTQPLPIDPPSTEASLRHLLTALGLLALGGFALWFILGR